MLLVAVDGSALARQGGHEHRGAIQRDRRDRLGGFTLLSPLLLQFLLASAGGQVEVEGLVLDSARYRRDGPAAAPNEAAAQWRSLVCVQRLCSRGGCVALAIQLREPFDDLRFDGLKGVAPADVA